MIITRKSAWSGTVGQMDLPVTQSELERHHNGAKAQDVWPDLSPDEREFIISGCTPGQWKEMIISINRKEG